MLPLPTPSDLISNITTWSSPIFTSWLPTAYFIIGVSIGSMLVVFLGVVVVNAVKYLVGHHSSGGSSRDEIHPRYRIVDSYSTNEVRDLMQY